MPSRRRLVLLRIPTILLRGLLRFFIRGGLLAGQGVLQHKVSSLIIAVMAVALFVLGQSYVSMTQARLGDSPPPGPSIESYIAGQKSYNAQMIWDSLNDGYRRRRLGGNIDGLQRQLEIQKRRGDQISEMQYVGGAKMTDGRSVFLYIITETNGKDTAQASYTFTIDQSGKIADIQ